MFRRYLSSLHIFIEIVFLLLLCCPLYLEGSVPSPVYKWRNGGYSFIEFNKAYYTCPATLDVNQDGTKDVIWANFKVFAFDGRTGNILWWFYTGTDRSNPNVRNDIATHCSVVVSDINADGQEDIVTAHSNGLLCAYDKNGYFLPGFPTKPTGRTDRIASLCVYDIDKNREMEIIIGWAIANNLNCCVIEHNGYVRPGWPQYVPNENSNALGVFNDNIAVHDINNDGYGEIIVPSDTGKTCAYYKDGTTLPVNPVFSEIIPTNTHWPHVVNYENYEYEKIGYSATGNFYMGTDQPATIADIDGDGTFEIVIVGQVFTKSDYDNLYTKPFIYNIDRTRYNKNNFNWENNLPQSGPPLSNNYQVIPIKTTNPVVVDIDGDGFKEILSSSYDGKLHCYWLDKNEHHSWPFSVYNSSEGIVRFSSEPAVADLDGDGNLEIIFTSWPQYYSGTSGHLFILNSKGEVIHQVALPYGDNGSVGELAFDGGLAAPTIDDIDNDGEPEIIVGMVYAGLVVYDLPGAGGGVQPWPTGRQNYSRTGWTPNLVSLYVLDGYGGVHSGGTAPSLTPKTPYFGWDIARDMEITSSGDGFYVLDGYGGVHSGGTAPALTPKTPYFGWDIARDMEITSSGDGFYILDGYGGVHSGGTASAPTPKPYYFGWDIARDMETVIL